MAKKQPKQEVDAEFNYELRSKAIAMFLLGHSPEYVVKELKVNINTARSWHLRRREILSRELREFYSSTIEMNLFQTIVESQEAMLAQLKVMKDAQWIRKQSAHDLAVLHGITHDKVIRLLEAAQPQSGDNDTGVNREGTNES